jgi:eukaryotic-like serine/threonine-protein kinase
VSDTDRLESIAEAVADGSSVDWSKAEESAHDPDTKSLLRNLRTLADISIRHRQLQASDPADDTLLPEALTQWAHLQILNRVGRGTFGEVYRAWDPRLDREVALKILREDALGKISPDAALAEARLLARVRHPNVVTVHGAEQIEGQLGIWMEFINGRTLAQIVAEDGPLAPAEAALIGQAVCRAVSAVHRAGLLHRDIKAQNIMREDGGRVVLTDFGTGIDPMANRTSTEKAGTPLYVAPEVLAGGHASVKSDVYAIGVLLFYLTTRTFPVGGTSVDEIARKHAQGQQRSLGSLRKDLPSEFKAVVNRALAPNPDRRYPTVEALEAALVRGPGESDRFLPRLPEATTSWRRGLRRILAGAGLLAMGAVAAWLWLAPKAVPVTAAQFAIYPDPGEDFDNIAVSPDGRWLVYSSKGSLWVRRMDSLEGRALPDTGGGHSPFWSPDGKFVAYFAGVDLKKIAFDGGAAMTLCNARRPRGGTWGPDGTIVFAVNLGAELQRVSANGGSPTVVRALDPARKEVTLRWPQFLPSGRDLLFTVRSFDSQVQGVYVRSLQALADKSERRILDVESNVIVGGGSLLYVRRGILMAQPFDFDRLRIVEAARPVAGRVDQEPLDDGFATFAASPSGVLAYRGSRNPNRQIRWFDRNGHMLGAEGPVGEYRSLALSRDDRHVAYEALDPEHGTLDIWVTDLPGGATRRLTFDDADEGAPVWSPDSQYIVYTTNRRNQVALYKKAASGVGEEELLIERQALPADWSADGRTLALELVHQMHGTDIWLFSLDDRKDTAYIESPSMERHAQFSPNGRWMAYSSSESGTRQVYVEPIPRTGVRWQISTRYGQMPLWRGDGRELFFMGFDEMLTSVDVTPTPKGPRFGLPRPLFRLRVAGGNLKSPYATTSDGRRFLVNTLVEDTRNSPIVVVTDWQRLGVR